MYRRQILQENIRWKALDEIYKIYMLLHRSDLNVSESFRQFFSRFFGKFLQKIDFWIAELQLLSGGVVRQSSTASSCAAMRGELCKKYCFTNNFFEPQYPFS